MLNVSVVNDEVVVLRCLQCVMYTFRCRITARAVLLCSVSCTHSVAGSLPRLCCYAVCHVHIPLQGHCQGCVVMQCVMYTFHCRVTARAVLLDCRS